MAQHPEAAAWCRWQCKALPLAATCSALPSCDLKFTCKGWQTDSSQSGSRTDSFHKPDNTPACFKSLQYCLNPQKRRRKKNKKKKKRGGLTALQNWRNINQKTPMNKTLRDAFQSRVMTFNSKMISLHHHKNERLTVIRTDDVALSLTSSETRK